MRNLGRRPSGDQATRSAATGCETPTEGLRRERAKPNTRLPRLAASFFTCHRAARALGYSE